MTERDGNPPATGVEKLPPASLEALQRFAEAQKQAAGDDRLLGRRALSLLEALLAAPERVSLQGIAQLAQAQGVHPSTLTRLARRLGFAGFKDFQKLFREDIAQTSRFYSSQAARLLSLRDREAAEAAGAEAGGPVADACDSELGNLVNTIRSLDAGEVKSVAGRLIEARRVYVIGLRGCYSAAHYLGYYLSFLRTEIITLGGAGFTIAEDLCTIGPDDVFVAVTFHPETRQTLDSCRVARDMGATVITISNHMTSPVRAFGHHNFHVHSQGPFYFNPMASVFLLLEALIAQVAEDMGGDAIGLLKQREAFFDKLNIE